MALRYFKGSDGKITVFRGSTRMFRAVSTTDPAGRHSISFAGTLGPGRFPVEEISKAEYQKLVRAKLARVSALDVRGSGSSPQDSWITNEAASRL